MTDIDLERLAKLQAEDTALKHMMQKHPENFQSIEINGVMLSCIFKDRPAIFVPKAMQTEIFCYIHGQGHPGFRQTKRNLQRSFIWPNFHSTTKKMVASCVACGKAKVTKQFRTPLQEFPVPNARYDHVHLDTIGPLPPSKAGYKYALTIIDRYSRMPQAVPLRAASAAATLSQFVSSWVALFGLPRTITLDNGSIFTSTEWKNFAKKYHISLNYTSTYHPQSNGLVERMHRSLKDALTAANQRDWASNIPWILLSMRNAAPDDMPYTPAEATFGGATRRPADLTSKDEPRPVKDFTAAYLQQPVPEPVKGRWHVNQEKQKQYLPDPRDPPKFVFVRNAHKRPLRDSYSGPFEVEKWCSKTVRIRVNSQTVSVSIDRVKPASQHEGQFLFYDKERDDAGLFDDDTPDEPNRITRSKSKKTTQLTTEK